MLIVSIDLLCVHGINHVHSEIVTVIFLKYKHKNNATYRKNNCLLIILQIFPTRKDFVTRNEN